MPTEAGGLDDVDKAGAVYDWMKGMAEDGEEDRKWLTDEMGKHYEIDTKTNEITKGNIGQESAEWDSPKKQEERRNQVKDAILEIAAGQPEATIPSLRNDLEKYGGTNDVTIIYGNKKKGLVHIAKRHGLESIAPVLDAMANGEITKFVPGNKTIWADKDGYRAILALEENGKKKTWLLTGFDIVDDEKNPADDSGKVSARHASTHTGPILSRPGMGAAESFRDDIRAILNDVKL